MSASVDWANLKDILVQQKRSRIQTTITEPNIEPRRLVAVNTTSSVDFSNMSGNVTLEPAPVYKVGGCATTTTEASS